MPSTLRSLTTGDLFRFNADDHSVWEYRGNGWYAHAELLDGGPWHESADVEVYPERDDYEPSGVPNLVHYQLRNDRPKHKPATFASTAATQRKLLDGLDCLPGQADLF